MRVRILRRVLISTLCAGLLPLAAQEFRATIVGTVTDQQGAVVPKVKIEVKNLATNVVVNTVSNETGNYVAPLLQPGRYAVSASVEGFKRAVRENVELRVADHVRVDFQMELGGVTQEVTVSGEAELLQTATASTGHVVDSAKIRDLPLKGRNPFYLLLLVPGVSSYPQFAGKPWDGLLLSINGSALNTNEILIDGVSNTGTPNIFSPSDLSFVPSPDATEEFKVQANTYDAQYGHYEGGVISAVTKSGTNRFHGTLYEYWRNDILNANSFQSNIAGNKRGVVRWNQPGVEFDGPVYLPKIYDGRNRTFFMYSWEAIRLRTPAPVISTVPTLGNERAIFQGPSRPMVSRFSSTIR